MVRRRRRRRRRVTEEWNAEGCIEAAVCESHRRVRPVELCHGPSVAVLRRDTDWHGRVATGRGRCVQAAAGWRLFLPLCRLPSTDRGSTVASVGHQERVSSRCGCRVWCTVKLQRTPSQAEINRAESRGVREQTGRSKRA
jgi:hypothetical protein